MKFLIGIAWVLLGVVILHKAGVPWDREFHTPYIGWCVISVGISLMNIGK